MSNRTTPNVAGDHRGLRQAEPTLPIKWYYDPAQYDIELKSIWMRHWQYVCRSTALAESHSYITHAIGDQRIVILRGSDGDLKAYHNTCRHRGSILMKAPEGKLGSKSIVCPYHQWCYASDTGALVRTTSLSEADDFNKADYGLFPVAVHEWRGCVFMHLDPDAAWDDGTTFHGLNHYLDNFPMEGLVVGHTWRKEMACNWKTFWDNFNECLHCPNIHPGLSDLVPLYGRRIVDEQDDPDWQDHADDPDPKFRGGLREGAETWSLDGSAQGYIIPGLSDADLQRGQTYVVALPGIFIAGFADHIRVVRLMPLGPERTELSVEWLFTKDALEAPDYDPMNVIEFSKQVLNEDLEACEMNQQGMHAAPMEAGVLMPEEYYLKDVQDWIRKQLT